MYILKNSPCTGSNLDFIQKDNKGQYDLYVCDYHKITTTIKHYNGHLIFTQKFPFGIEQGLNQRCGSGLLYAYDFKFKKIKIVGKIPTF